MVSNGMNIHKALRLARSLGCEVYPPRRTGKTAVRPPSGAEVRFHHQLDTAPRTLVQLLRRLEARGAAKPKRRRGVDRFAAPRKAPSGSFA